MKNISVAIITDIISYIDPKFVSFYDMNKEKSKYYMDSFNVLVEDILQNNIADKEPSALSKYATSKAKVRNVKKSRYYVRCENDVSNKIWENTEGLDKFFAKDIVYAYNALNEKQRKDSYNGKNLESLIKDSLEKVLLWSKDNNSLMIEYPGKDKITSRNACSNFTLDLEIEILRVIKEQYRNDLGSQTTSYLENLVGESVFGLRTRYPINKNGVTQIEIVSKIDPDYKTVITYDGTVGLDFVTLLDEIDQSIISYFVNRAILAPPTQRPILIPEIELVRGVVLKNGDNRKISKKDRDMVFQHIYKMQHMAIDRYYKGEHVGGHDIIGSTDLQKIGGTKIIDYYPSEYIMHQVENGYVMRLPTTERDSLENDVAKLLYMPLMHQRFRIYRMLRSGQAENKTYKVKFKRIELLRYVNLGNCGIKKEIEILSNALQDYINKGFMISNYTYTRVTEEFSIDFMPLSDREIQDIDYVYFGQAMAAISNDIIGNVMGDIISPVVQPVIDSAFS